jgi:hypothetical protein
MTFLREIKTPFNGTNHKILDIFDGDDIEKDKEYWVKYHKASSVRYFKVYEQ